MHKSHPTTHHGLMRPQTIDEWEALREGRLIASKVSEKRRLSGGLHAAYLRMIDRAALLIAAGGAFPR